LIDPKAHRRRRPRPAELPVDLAEVHALMLELAPLAGLAWQPLAERVEALTTALRGGDGVGPGLVNQLRTWAHRWAALHADLRAFYTRHAEHPAAEAALWRILDGGDRLRGPLRGQLDRLWIEDHGAEPNIHLVPRPSPATDSSR
jgi:hypothetical protein